MENIVECKVCNVSFNYVPGPNGNARQLCDKCRIAEDEKEIEIIKEETIVEGNKYLVSSEKWKNKYDPSDILVNGNMPTFNSEAEMFICALEVGYFCRRNKGFMGCDDNAVKLLLLLSPPNRIMFLKQQCLFTMEYMCKTPVFKPFVELMAYVIK